jgi:hypothetical protein
MVICDSALYTKNYDHALQVNPTLFIHSAVDPDVDNTQWLSLAHDQTNAVIGVGKGSLSVNVPTAVDMLIVPGGSTGTNPGLSFVAVTDTGLGADANNLLIYESGALACVLSNLVKEFRVPSTYSFSFSSVATNLASSDTRISRGATGDIILDPITEITEVCGVGLKTKEYNLTLNNGAKVNLPAGTGWGTFMIGDNQEYARIRWTAAAVVTLDEGTANVAIADTPAFFCLYDDVATVAIKNNLGVNLTLRYVIHYS